MATGAVSEFSVLTSSDFCAKLSFSSNNSENGRKFHKKFFSKVCNNCPHTDIVKILLKTEKILKI
jgi:hypothetical protein